MEEERGTHTIFIDYKTKLQEYLHRKNLEFSYRLLKEEGPSHEKQFTVGLYIDQKLVSTAVGRSKKGAEKEAAKIALEKISAE